MNDTLRNSQTIYDPKTKIWSGKKVKLRYGPEYSIGQAALEALMKQPEHIAQITYDSDKSYTNREIATLSIRVAQHFKTLPVQQCDVIGICAANTDFLAPLFFGAMLSGLTVSTLDPSFDEDGIKHIFSITKPKIMFCDGAIYASVLAAFEENKIKAKIYTMKDHISGVPEITEFLQATGTEADYKPEALKLGAAQVATILCSSGTTGLPKGVCFSHDRLTNYNLCNTWPGIILSCYSTLYWLTGVLSLVFGTIGGATRIISEHGFTPETFFTMMQKYRITTLITPPSQLAMAVASPKIKDYDLSSMINYFCGGSAVPYSLVEKMKVYMPNAVFYAAYGMSEIGGCVAIDEAIPNGSMGLDENSEVKITNDEGVSLGPNEAGEVCMRIPYRWAGYYGNPEATKAIYTADGWIHSGDVGYFNEDDKLCIVGRIKEILKYNNFHFSPTEIENVILEMPGVAEVCVCGIPDIVSTHLPAAAIVKTLGSTLTQEQVYEYVAKKMAHFKQLRGGVYFMNELVKTASGKNRRNEITTICEKLRMAGKCGPGYFTGSIVKQKEEISPCRENAKTQNIN